MTEKKIFKYSFTDFKDSAKKIILDYDGKKLIHNWKFFIDGEELKIKGIINYEEICKIIDESEELTIIPVLQEPELHIFKTGFKNKWTEKIIIELKKIGIREELTRLVIDCERILRENDWKEHWGNMSIDELFLLLSGEVYELSNAIIKINHSDIRKECCDAVNYLMMIYNKAEDKNK